MDIRELVLKTRYSACLLMVMAFIGVFSSKVVAQSPFLFQDVYAGADSLPFNPNSLIEYQDELVFLANDGINGRELWTTEGDTAVMIRDIRAGFEGSNPEFFIIFGDELIFRAFDDTHGMELWRYDGTRAIMLRDIFPGDSSSLPSDFYVFQDALYFAANDGVHGQELWRYDGTRIDMIEDIRSGEGRSDPRNFMAFNGELFFNANDGINGLELWKYDGNQASLAQDINEGMGSSNPRELMVFDNQLYFVASDGKKGSELWKYDGGSATIAYDINSQGSSNPSDLTILSSDELVFIANDGQRGVELWKYDGSEATIVNDINPGSAGAAIPSLTKVANKVFFAANNGSQGEELWNYDGEEASIVSDINRGVNGAEPRNLTAFGGNLYFSALLPNIGRELFRYNGQRLEFFDINPTGSSSPGFMQAVNCDLYFGAIGSIETGVELWQLPLAGNIEVVIDETVCEDKYVAPDGRSYSASGTYDALVTSSIGCDSLITLNLTFGESTSSSISEIGCEFYEAPDGQIYSENGTYIAIIPNQSGCDSTITIDLNIVNINTEVAVDGLTLTALAQDVSYQWLDCENNFAPIPGATAPTFTPEVSGSYVAQLTSPFGCVDTTSCVNGVVLSLNPDREQNTFKLYPTFTQTDVTIALGGFFTSIEVVVIDLEGRVTKTKSFKNVEIIDLEMPEAQGYYIVKVLTENNPARTFKVLKY